jgi:hypothetical protein
MHPLLGVRIGFVCIILLLSLAACNFPEKTDLTAVPPVEITKPSQEDTETSVTPTPGYATATPAMVASHDLAELVLVYTSSQDLFLFQNGKPERLTNSGDIFFPRISPDGEIIAFLRPVDDIHLEIWCINRDGTRERQLVSVEDMDVIAGGVRDPSAVAVNPSMDYGWLPGTHSLAFTSQQVYQGPGTNFLDDLILVSADTGEVSPLFLAGWGGRFVFSPDGKKIAISQANKIMLANLDGSSYQTVLTYDSVTTYSEYRYYASPVWSPDGKYLMVAVPPVDPLAIPADLTELWRLNTDGSPPVLMAGVQAVPFMESEIRLSPDLLWFIYLTGEFESNSREIHLAASDASRDMIVAQASPVIPQGWSPDSQHFIFTQGIDQGTWTANTEGRITAIGSEEIGNHLLAWRDNKSYIFWTQAAEGFELWYGTLDGAFLKLDQISGNPPSISILY